jgi:hypothetical protein
MIWQSLLLFLLIGVTKTPSWNNTLDLYIYFLHLTFYRGKTVEKTVWLLNESHMSGDKNALVYDEISETYDQVSQ